MRILGGRTPRTPPSKSASGNWQRNVYLIYVIGDSIHNRDASLCFPEVVPSNIFDIIKINVFPVWFLEKLEKQIFLKVLLWLSLQLFQFKNITNVLIQTCFYLICAFHNMTSDRERQYRAISQQLDTQVNITSNL